MERNCKRRVALFVGSIGSAAWKQQAQKRRGGFLPRAFEFGVNDLGLGRLVVIVPLLLLFRRRVASGVSFGG